MNEKINEQVKDFVCMPESDYIAVLNEFLKPYKRWGWVGDLSKDEDKESVYAIVDDDTELKAVAGIFEDLLEDVEFVQE